MALEEILPDVDLVLIMSVNPGFGGQSYIPGSTDKIRRLRQMLDAIGSTADLEVDGGIKPGNAAEIAGRRSQCSGRWQRHFWRATINYKKYC